MVGYQHSKKHIYFFSIILRKVYIK